MIARKYCRLHPCTAIDISTQQSLLQLTSRGQAEGERVEKKALWRSRRRVQGLFFNGDFLLPKRIFEGWLDTFVGKQVSSPFASLCATPVTSVGPWDAEEPTEVADEPLRTQFAVDNSRLKRTRRWRRRGRRWICSVYQVMLWTEPCRDSCQGQ